MAGAVVSALDARDRSERQRWITLVVLCAGFLMIVLDRVVVNVALPSIQDVLGFSQASLAGVVDACLIAFGGLFLLAGRLGVDRADEGVESDSWEAESATAPGEAA
jgi:hypothetical protein